MSDEPTTAAGEDPDKKIAELEGDITNPTTKPQDEVPPFPGLQHLGCGYDVFGRYASKDSIKALLFDFSKENMVKQQFLDGA